MATMYPSVFRPKFNQDDFDKIQGEISDLEQQANEAPNNPVLKEQLEEKRSLKWIMEAKRRGDEGEELVYNILKDELPNDWCVFHSVSIYGRGEWLNGEWEYDSEAFSYLDREIDFLVLVPERGFFVIEVKNWMWDWTQSKTSEDRAPHDQAKTAMYDFANWLLKCCGLSGNGKKLAMNYGFVVLMLGVKVDKYLRGEARDRYLWGEEQIRIEIKDYIETRLSARTIPNNKVGAVDRELTALHQRLVSLAIYKISMADYDRILNRAAAQLNGILPMLSESPSAITVRGCAGSGKTVMAMDEATRLAGAGNRVLYLCFNKNLSVALRHRSKDVENLEVYHFHDFCYRVLDLKFDENTVTDRDRGNMTEEYVKKYNERIARLGKKYDFLFVDEAQDFKKAYWDVLRYIVIDSHKRFFYDSNQQLRDRNNCPPPTPILINLNTNLRNSKEISEYGAKVLKKGDIVPLDLSSQQVEISAAHDSADTRATEVCRIIFDEILKNSHVYGGVCMSQIVILSPWAIDGRREADCSLKLIAQYVDERRKKQKKSQDGKKNRRVRLMGDPTVSYETLLKETLLMKDGDEAFAGTIRSFKGLEADYVILTDIPMPADDPNSGFSHDDFYVGCTRAKYGLYIVPMNKDAEKYARDCLPSSKKAGLGDEE